ncbi:uncharacterized protein LOC126742655 isoform X2 [Anthonomus grandis grandis]|nr:uncharacterized protein LOC126742655 isoform X2 [Anthonomus grandis grandis]
MIVIKDDEPPKNFESSKFENVTASSLNTSTGKEVKVIWHQKKYTHLEVGPEYVNNIVIYGKKYQEHYIACYQGLEYIRRYNQKNERWLCNKSFDCPALLFLGAEKGTNKIFMVNNHICGLESNNFPEIDYPHKSEKIVNVVYHSNIAKTILNNRGFQKFAKGILILDDIVEPTKAYFNTCTFIRGDPYQRLQNENLSNFYTFHCAKRRCYVDLYISKEGSHTKMTIEIDKHDCLRDQRFKSCTSDISCPPDYSAVTSLKFRNRQDLALYEKLEYFVKKRGKSLGPSEQNKEWPYIYIHHSHKSLIYKNHIYNLISNSLSSDKGYICHYNRAPKCSALLKVTTDMQFVLLVYGHTCPYKRPDSLNQSSLSYTICQIEPDPNFKREIKALCEPINHMIEPGDIIFQEEYATLKKLSYHPVRYTLDLNASLKEINEYYDKAELLEQKYMSPHVLVCTDLSNNRRLELYKRHAYVVDYTAPITELRICKDSVICSAALSWRSNSSMIAIIGKHTCMKKKSQNQIFSPPLGSSTSKKDKLESKKIPKSIEKRGSDRQNSTTPVEAKKNVVKYNINKEILKINLFNKKQQINQFQDELSAEITKSRSNSTQKNYKKKFSDKNQKCNELQDKMFSNTSVLSQANKSVAHETNGLENPTLDRIDLVEKIVQDVGGFPTVLTESSKPSVFSYNGYKYHLGQSSSELFQCFRSNSCTGNLRLFTENGNEKVIEGIHTCDTFKYRDVNITISSCKDFNQVPGFNPTDPLFITMLVNVGNSHNILYYRGFTYIDDRSLSCERGEFSVTLKSCNMIYMCAKSNVCSAGLSINLRESEAMEIGVHTCTISNNLTEKSKLFREFHKVTCQRVNSLSEDEKFPLLGEEQLVLLFYEHNNQKTNKANENNYTFLYKGHTYRHSISGCSFSHDAGCKTLYLCDLTNCTAALLIDSRTVKSVLEVGLHSCKKDNLEEERKKIMLRNDIEISINQMLQRLAIFTGQKSIEMMEIQIYCINTLRWLDSNPNILREKLEEIWVRLNTSFNAFHLSTPTFLKMIKTTPVNVTPIAFVNNSETSTVVQTKINNELIFPKYCPSNAQTDIINRISGSSHIVPASANGILADNSILPETLTKTIKRKFDQTMKASHNQPRQKKSNCGEAELKENTHKIKIDETSQIFQQPICIEPASDDSNVVKEHKYVVISTYNGFLKAILFRDKIYVAKDASKNGSKWICRFNGCNAIICITEDDQVYCKSEKHICQECNLVEVEVLEHFQKAIGGTSEILWDPNLVPVFDKNKQLYVIYQGFVYGSCVTNNMTESTIWTCIDSYCASIMILKDGKPITDSKQHNCMQNFELSDTCQVFEGSNKFFMLGHFIYTPRLKNCLSNVITENQDYLECIYYKTLGCPGNAIITPFNYKPDSLKQHTCKLLKSKNCEVETRLESIIIKQEQTDVFIEEGRVDLGEKNRVSNNDGLSNLVISDVFSLSDCKETINTCQGNKDLFCSEETLSSDETSKQTLSITNEGLQPIYELELSENVLDSDKQIMEFSVLSELIDNFPNLPIIKSPQENISNIGSSVTIQTNTSAVTTSELPDAIDDFEDAIPVTYLISKE